MKKLSMLTVMIISALMISCGGGSKESAEEKAERRAKEMMEKMGVDASEFDAMKEALEEVAENAEKIAEEEASESEEDQMIYSDKNAALMGLTVAERKIADADWEKAKVLAEKYKAMENEQLRELTHEKIETMIMDAGFTDLETAKGTLAGVSECYDVITSLGMKVAMAQSTRMIDG